MEERFELRVERDVESTGQLKHCDTTRERLLELVALEVASDEVCGAQIQLPIGSDPDIRYVQPTFTHAAGDFQHRFVGVQSRCSCDAFVLFVLKGKNAFGFLCVSASAACSSCEHHS